MAAIDRFILLVRAMRRDQGGIAVPTALMALVASFALGSVAVMSTVDVQRGMNRDHDSKEAIAAADAGASIALLRLNRFQASLPKYPCIGPNGETQTAENVSGVLWCPWTTPEKVGEASYKYRVSAFTAASGVATVVSVGTSGTVSRRVSVGLKTLSGKRVFADEKLIGQDSIELNGGGSLKIETDIGTNGNIIGSGSPYICGNDRHGIGMDAPTPNCPGKEELEGNKVLPQIVPPENILTVNDDCRLSQTCTGEKAKQVDTYTGDTTNKVGTVWKPGAIGIQGAVGIASSQTLTMGGTVYFVCELNIKGKLYMPVGAHVEIYVDTPKNCGLKSGAQQVEVAAGAIIESSANNSTQGLHDVPRIYVLGDGAVKLVGTPGTTNEVILYAPNSEVDLGGNATWNGMIAGKALKVHGNPIVKSDPNLKEPEITLSGNFQRTQYVECVGGTVSPPNASC